MNRITLSRESAVMAIVLLATAVQLPAANITWNAPVTIAGDSDVNTSYYFDFANSFAFGTTVNGVTFTAGDPRWTYTGVGDPFDAGYAGFDNGGVGSPVSGLSAAYRSLLAGGHYEGDTSATGRMTGLIAGQDYLVQVWVNDSRLCCGSRTETITGGSNTSGLLSYNNTIAAGGVGQYVIGNFTADASTQDLTFNGDASAQINGIQLRAKHEFSGAAIISTSVMSGWPTITVNSGGSVNIAATNILAPDHGTQFNGLITINGGGSFYNSGGSVNRIGDVTLNGGVLTANAYNGDWGSFFFGGVSGGDPTITVGGSTASTINGGGNFKMWSNVNFNVADATGDPNADLTVSAYLENQTAGQGYAAAALTKTGAGTMVLGGANTYSGISYINAGKLVAASTRALGSGGVTIAAGATLTVSALAANTGLTLLDSNWGYDLGQISTLPFAQRLLAVTGPTFSQVTGATYGNGSDTGRYNFSQLYTGMIKINTGGVYDFNTTSDDGSVLWIDGQQVVYNNYYQGMTQRSGSISLSAGYHNIQVALQQGGGGYGLYSQFRGADTGGNWLDINTANAQITPDLVLGSLSGSGNVQLSTGNLIAGADNSSTTFSGVITSDTGVPAGLLKVGSGQLTLSGANTYVGDTTVANGWLRLANAGGAAVQGNVIMANPGSFLIMDQPNQFGPNSALTFSAYDGHAEFALYGHDQTIAGLTSVNGYAVVQNSHGGIGPASASSTLTINQNIDTTYSGVFRNNTGNDGFTLAVVKTGSGKLTLNTVADYTGGTTVNGGTLSLTANSGNGAIRGTLTVNPGGTVVTTGDGTGLGWNGAARVTTLNINEGLVTSAGVMHIWNLPGGVNLAGGTLQSNNGVSDPGGAQLEWNYADVNVSGSATATSAIGGRIRMRADGGYPGITFNVGNGSAATDLLVSAAITEASGGLGITKNGAGTMALTGYNNYSGTTTVNGGTLSITGGGKIYGGAGWAGRVVVVNSTGVLEIDQWNGDGSLGQSDYGSGGLVLNGGTLRYTGSETTTPSFIDGGNGRAFSLGAGGGTLESAAPAGKVFAITQYTGDPGVYALPSFSSTLTLTGTGDGYISKAISGTGGLTKSGSGTWTLAAGNTYSGGTTVNGGTLKIGNNQALGNYGSVVTVNNGGALDVADNDLWNYTQPIVINGAGPSGGGAIIKSTSGDGTLWQLRSITLGSDASIGGVATSRIDIGRGDWPYPSGLGTSPIHIDGQGNTLSVVGNVYLGVLAGAQNLAGVTIKTGATVAPHADNSFGNAPVTLDGGVLSPWGGHTFADNVIVTSNGGFIDNQGYFDTYNGTLQVNGPLQINTIAGGNITANGNISGGGVITKIGGYSLLLGGNNSGFTGTFNNNQSNTFFTDPNAGSAAATWTINTGILANLNGSNPAIHLGALSGSGGYVGNNTPSTVTYVIGELNTATTYSGTIVDSVGGGGTTAITKTGSGTLTLTANNSYTAGTTVNQGVLEINGSSGGNGYIRGTATVNSGAELRFTGGDGTGFGFNGGNKLVTLNINGGLVSSPGAAHVWNMTGGINMAGGTLQSNNGVSDPGASQLEWNWTDVNVSASATTTSEIGGRIRMRADGGYPGITFNVGNGSAATDLLASAAITEASGGLGITKTGAGTMALTGNNNYSGVTTLAGGILNVATLSNYGSPGSLGNRAAISDGPTNVGILFRGGTLQYTGSTPQSTDRAIRISTAGGAILDASGSTPSATMSFLATSSPDFFENPGDRQLTLTGSNTGNNTFAMAIQEAVGTTTLTKNGVGQWVLTGNNTYTGATTVNQGTLLLSGTTGRLNGTTQIDVNPGATLALAGNGQILTGTVALNGGTVRQNSSAYLTRPITFDPVNGGTITGGGVIDATGYGGLTVGSGAVLSPGNSPGSQNYEGTLSWASGGKYHWEINDWTGTPGTDPGWDLIDLHGYLDLSGLGSGNKFTIEISSLTLANTAGLPANFDRALSAAFPILQTTVAIDSNFSTNMFVVDPSGFGFSASYASWSIYQQGNTLFLQYTALIPEPTTVMLLGLGGLLLLVGRRLRRRS